MKKFIQNIIKLLLPFAIILALVNCVIDPVHIFTNGKYEADAASVILKGHNINYIQNCDERLLIKNILPQLYYKPDVVIVGTSRSLEISSDFFPSKKIYNASLSHANINDFIGIIGLLDSTNKLPSEIYIETSPTLINPTPTDEWITLYDFYLYGIKKMKLDLKPIEVNPTKEGLKKKVKTIFAFNYFQESVLSIGKTKNKQFVDVGNNTPDNFGKMNDGSITYSIGYRTPDTIKAMADAEMYISKAFLPNIDLKYLSILNQIIDYLKSKNINVTLVNIPFQHDCYKIVNGKNRLFEEIKSGIISFANETHTPLIGTFDPYEIGLKRNQFYDPLHCNKDALRSVMNIFQSNTK